MTAEATDPIISNNMYADHVDGGVTSERERERLQTFAEVTDRITLQRFDELDITSGATVLIAGSGADPGLPYALDHYDVICSDKDASAVRQLQQYGIQSHHAALERMEFACDQSCDAIIARAVLGWMDTEQREAALKEMVRITTPGGSLLLQDFDWDTMRLPEEAPDSLAELIGTMRSILESAGFTADYGAALYDEVRSVLHDVAEIDTVSDEVRPSSPKDFVVKSAHSIIALLTAQPDEAARLLAVHMEGLLQDVAAAPESDFAEFVLPRLISVAARLKASSDGDAEIADGMETTRQLFPGVAGMEQAYLVRGDDVRQARSIHAKSYLRAGHVTEEGVHDGLLREELSPTRLTEASEHFVICADGSPVSTMRVILPDRLQEAVPAMTGILTANARGELDPNRLRHIDDITSVVELSAFGSISKDFALDPVRAAIAGIEWARREGRYQYAAASVVDSTWENWMIKVLGPVMDALRDTDGNPIYSEMSGLPGLRAEGVKFVYCLFPLESFVPSVLEHNRVLAAATGPRASASRRIVELCESVLAS